METPGKRFLRFRRLELMEFISYSTTMVRAWKRGLETYVYTPEQEARVREQISDYEIEIASAERDLAEMGGAENEEVFLTEPKRSESPQLERISCTTVL